MIVEHGGEVFCDPGHAARADRLDAGLLNGLEHAACLRIARHQLAMHFGIVAGEFQRDGIGVSAHDGGIAPRHLARRLRQPRLARREAGPFGSEGHFQLRRFGDRAQARRHRALERLGRRLLGAGAEFGIGWDGHGCCIAAATARLTGRRTQLSRVANSHPSHKGTRARNPISARSRVSHHRRRSHRHMLRRELPGCVGSKTWILAVKQRAICSRCASHRQYQLVIDDPAEDPISTDCRSERVKRISRLSYCSRADVLDSSSAMFCASISDRWPL